MNYDDSLSCLQCCHLSVSSRLSRSCPRGGLRCRVVDDFDRKDGREPGRTRPSLIGLVPEAIGMSRICYAIIVG
jgi:hypothetical protein